MFNLLLTSFTKVKSAILILSLMMIYAPLSSASSPFYDFHGMAKLRKEYKANASYVAEQSNHTSFNITQVKMSFKAKPQKVDAWHIFMEPQFQKRWGRTETSPTTGAAGTQTSGALFDTRMEVHQGYLYYTPSDDISFKIGRQEIVFGDHLVIGNVGWNEVGRSFDAVRMTWNYDGGKVDLLGSKIQDTNTAGAGAGDHDLYGIYSANDMGDYLKEFDLYVLYRRDHRQAISDREKYVISYGTRLKSNIGNSFYRTEATFQNGRDAGIRMNNEFQFDIELGHKCASWFQFSLEYFIASKKYDQFFPTAHKWLGFADQFSRRNIKGYVVHLKSKLSDDLSLNVDWHNFFRKNTDTSAFNFGGTAITTGVENSSEGLAQEIDVTLKYKLAKGLNLTAGHSVIVPKAHLASSRTTPAVSANHKRDSTVHFSYLELKAFF